MVKVVVYYLEVFLFRHHATVYIHNQKVLTNPSSPYLNSDAFLSLKLAKGRLLHILETVYACAEMSLEDRLN